LKKLLDENFLRAHHSMHHISLGKNPNASEGSIFLVTVCSFISGSSAKYCLEAPHSLEPFYFPKSPFTSTTK
jgi:hypothetical protein